MTFTSKFNLLETVEIREIPMLITHIDFAPKRVSYCLSWISNGAYNEMWLGEEELFEFINIKKNKRST